MSYLLNLYLFAYSGVPHILCCVFVLFAFVLCTQCCHLFWIVHYWLPIWYSLTFIFELTFSSYSSFYLILFNF
jgi:hypothetical protein